jgi:hypothetical protein
MPHKPHINNATTGAIQNERISPSIADSGCQAINDSSYTPNMDSPYVFNRSPFFFQFGQYDIEPSFHPFEFNLCK